MKQALSRTLPGGAIIGGAVVKIAVAALGLVGSVPLFLRAIDTAASVAIAAGGLYFLALAVRLAKERLLWRLHSKLIVSYIFIGFVPAFLIVAFFLLVGLILFSTFSSYLVQTELQALGDDVSQIAERTALDIQRGGDIHDALRRQHAAEAGTFPNLTLA